MRISIITLLQQFPDGWVGTLYEAASQHDLDSPAGEKQDGKYGLCYVGGMKVWIG